MYTIIAFVNLGNTKSPQTSFTFNKNTEVTFEFNRSENIKKVEFLLGPRNNNKFEILYSDNGSDFTVAKEIEGESVFAWKQIDVDFTGRFVKIKSLSNELIFMEMGFRNNTNEIANGNILGSDGNQLFDEQA